MPLGVLRPRPYRRYEARMQARHRPADALPGFLTEYDLHLLAEGTHFRSWEKLGAHLTEVDGRRGIRFAVVAPNAGAVSVIGDFNDWDADRHPMQRRGQSGVWECFVPSVEPGALYKFAIRSRLGNYRVAKADPYAFYSEVRPGTASRVWNLDGYAWGDADWLERRRRNHHLQEPISIYEIHLGSWMRIVEEGSRWLTYREAADKLTQYVLDMGYTHVEFLPLSEHPFDGSWGYQTVGYFAPTSRFGTPQDFMHLVDTLHQNGIGVLIDWVPAHFPRDEHGLSYFDGTHLYEHADPRQGEHRDWKTLIFNYGRWEVRNFLISNALFWLDVYHIDGLRVDAVASMLYLDYSREPGDWIPNRHGGRENLDAVDFLRQCNERVYAEQPGAMVIAEESTSWAMVSRPTYLGGLGFGFKWDMGWMNDTLRYLAREPIHRKFHHNDLTFRMLYAFTENFMLPLSHDEVVHGKGSLLGKMSGDNWQKFANLRLLLGYMFTQPSKKLLFMGGDIGQWREWNHDGSIDWHLLQHDRHRGIQSLVRDLNALYKREAALHQLDCDNRGFEWIDCHDSETSTLSYLRRSLTGESIVVACNFTPVPRHDFRIGVSTGGWWRELFNSDSALYGGSNLGNGGGIEAQDSSCHGRPHQLAITLPPLAFVVFKA
ncbi:MAG: 1,4-alpha-glucan branching protein GlgB [Deltaproteobacteria bacterium]|nr:1,4-alpha-glucan branching protein GlgB [Deltaproteobacteria bacterium]